MVLVVQEGWGASTAATREPGAAIDSAIVGVVDYMDLLAEENKGVRR
jgi:microcompartment protein CcmK/EutM